MNRKILSVLCIFTLILAVTMPSQAATGYQGYAIYRDGVLGPVNWHGGLMDKPSKDDIYPVIHIGGPDYQVEYVWWHEFTDGTEDYPYSKNSFMGYYRPVSQNPTSAQRDAVVATARQLASNFIDYCGTEQMHYDETSSTTKTYVQPSDIDTIRCDGVVEYCYEYNNIRIYGSDMFWNIARWGALYEAHHASPTAITPRKQAQDYMYVISYNP